MSETANIVQVKVMARRTLTWRTARLGCAILLLLGYAASAVWLFRECSRVITTDPLGQATTVSTCGPPSLTSSTVLVMILLLAALLWPDISEIAVLGVSLKRQVVQAEESAKSARLEVDRLRGDIEFQLTQVSAASNASARSENSFYFGSGNWGENEAKRLQEVVALKDDQEQLRLARTAADLSDSEVKLQVLSIYEVLASLLGLNASRSRGRPTREESRAMQVQQWFVDDNRPTLDVVQSLRNAIAHSRDVPRSDVEEGLALAEQLIPHAKLYLTEHGVQVSDFANKDVGSD